MAIYSAEERAALELALEGSGILAANLDGNLTGVLKALVSMRNNATQRALDAEIDVEVLRTAARELERQLREVSGIADGYRQAVWCLVRRSNGIAQLSEEEMSLCPSYPPVTVIRSVDPPGWDIVCELPEIPPTEEIVKEES